jgi:HAD superfamily phosphatase (TIGR01668 family)
VFAPDLYYSSVEAIDLDELAGRGITALLLDMDNTILPRDTGVLPTGMAAWVTRVRQAGFTIFLVSNNWHSRVAEIGAELDVPVVGRALKPLPVGFRRAVAQLGIDRAHAAVVGDQIFTDVLGGRLAGLTTVLVDPLVAHDLPHTLLLRKVEARIMAGRRPLA